MAGARPRASWAGLEEMLDVNKVCVQAPSADACRAVMHPVPRELLRTPLKGGAETRPCALQLWNGVEERLFEMMSEPGKMAHRRDCQGSDDGQPRVDNAGIRRQRMQMYAAEDRVKAHGAQSVSPVQLEAGSGRAGDSFRRVDRTDAPVRQRILQAVAAGTKPSATKNAHRSWCRFVQARAPVPPVLANCSF